MRSVSYQDTLNPNQDTCAADQTPCAQILVPSLLTAPRYFAGQIEFGVIAQASAPRLSPRPLLPSLRAPDIRALAAWPEDTRIMVDIWHAAYFLMA